ncbi:MAG: hypothetical protein O9286_15310 [Aquidulcibacter sp.]|uniref:hypothetical protein n=1 Tax=Aquidulcibacter sp. TaxID=2052990 RepID=UPI0022C6642A|nr:hypothetical protein [Aquidulcibacter sp.]
MFRYGFSTKVTIPFELVRVVAMDGAEEFIFGLVVLISFLGFLGFISLTPSAPSTEPTPIFDFVFKIGRLCMIPTGIMLVIAVLSLLGQCSGGGGCSDIIAGSCVDY